jgi:hypothetical protein
VSELQANKFGGFKSVAFTQSPYEEGNKVIWGSFDDRLTMEKQLLCKIKIAILLFLN